MVGVVIDSRQATNRFMSDWRETVTDLFAENYYGYMSQLAHEHGLKLLVQPYGTGSAQPFNPINTTKVVRQLAADDPISAEYVSVRLSIKGGLKDLFGYYLYLMDLSDIPLVRTPATQDGAKKFKLEDSPWKLSYPYNLRRE